MFHANETVFDEMLFDNVSSLPLEIKVFFLYQWSYNDHISIYQFMVLIKEIRGLFIWRWAGPERWTGSPRWDRTFSKKHLICSYEKKTRRDLTLFCRHYTLVRWKFSIWANASLEFSLISFVFALHEWSELLP